MISSAVWVEYTDMTETDTGQQQRLGEQRPRLHIASRSKN